MSLGGATVRGTKRAASLAALALIAFLFIYPLARLLALPASVPGEAVGGWRAVGDSLLLAVITAAIAAPLGAVLAGFVSTYSGITARIAVLTLWGLFLAPSYVLTTGWMIVFTRPELRLSALGAAFFGSGGLVALFVLKALPFAAFVTRATLSGTGAALGEAARVHGLSRLRRFRIQLHLIAPALGIGFAVAVIETMQEFGIPATLGTASRMPLLTYAIYQRLAQTPTDFAGAAVLCWRLVGIAAALALGSLAVQRRDAAVRGGRTRSILRRRPDARTALGCALLLAVVLTLGFVVPTGALVLRATSGGPWTTPHLGAVARSLGFGIVSSAVALLTGFALLKLRAASTRRIVVAIDAALLANMAVPGLVLGAGYIIAFNNRFLPLYGTTALLVVAYAAATIPLAVRMVEGALADLDRNLDAAARLHGLSRRTRAIDIEAALLAEPIGYGFLVAAGAIMFELPISELLYPPGATPLGVAIVFLDQMGDFAAAARLALLGLAAVMLFAAILVGALRLFAAPRRAMLA